ncbi:hypothetical protein [Thalassomonas actiniarum]|uniref:HMW1C N-terminal domain-containing protein n=1 Tax=Thalassomonas actiniarum TaxID=485447 RepID=A0AAF0C365_9GAMM|nr:hypothetical protein [Thalassomonas actiniarum]WDD99262.1 hypothetical protein SG35_000805 [Thalassomonas actiniarum]
MNFNIQSIAQNIRTKNFHAAEQDIIMFIEEAMMTDHGLMVQGEVNSLLPQAGPDKEELMYTFCNKFATLITELFSAPGYKPSPKAVNSFIIYKMSIDWIFSASIWNSTDGLIDHLGLYKPDKFGQIKFNEKQLTLLLMLIGLSSKIRLPWKDVFKAAPALALTTYIGLITQPIPALTNDTNKGFNYLLESAKYLPMLDLPVIADLGKLTYCYFACSYATSSQKYEFKKWLTALIRHNLPLWLSDEVKQYIAAVPAFAVKPKMKIAVILESYSEIHAMFRSYNRFLTELSQHYELIAYIEPPQVEDNALRVFSKVIEIKDVNDVDGNAAAVAAESPDIVLYPSIGMRLWAICLSQLRLAPKQLMMGGHPSSSYSPEIDAMLIPGNTFKCEDIQPYFEEKVVMTDIASKDMIFHTIHPDLTDGFINDHNHFLPDSDEIIIAVNGVMTKVTYPVIDICKQIERKTKKKVTFIFFSGHKGNHLAYLSTKKQLGKMLKSFELVNFSNYLDYMKVISKAHLLLPTLPFGGSNSNTDAIVLNKPKLFIKGTQHFYTRTDTCIWDKLDMLDELGCDSVAELVSKAVSLVDDEAQRKRLYDLMLEKQCFYHIFNTDVDKYATSMKQLFEKALVEA